MKHCPFCGCRKIDEGLDDTGRYYYVKCHQCMANQYALRITSIKEAMDNAHWLWNQRAGFDWQSLWKGFLKGFAMPFTWMVSLFRRKG